MRVAYHTCDLKKEDTDMRMNYRDLIDRKIADSLISLFRSGLDAGALMDRLKDFHEHDIAQALEELGVTGMTVTSVYGHGVQKGHSATFRGAPVEARLLPKMKVDVVISKIPTQTLVDTVQKTLYTGHIGDGKIFLYDVEQVVKVRTGETGYDALQDEV